MIVESAWQVICARRAHTHRHCRTPQPIADCTDLLV